MEKEQAIKILYEQVKLLIEESKKETASCNERISLVRSIEDLVERLLSLN